MSEHGDLDAKLVGALERAGQALRVQLWDTAKQHGLNPIQLQVLLRLAADPPTAGRVGALAAAFDVSQPSMSDTVAALRRKALVRDRPRRGGVVLTARGRALVRELDGWGDRTREALAAVPAADKERTLGVLLGVIAGLQRSGAITVARMCTTCRFFRPAAHPGEPRPHHCALLDAPLGEGDLRVDCAEHQPKAA